MPENATRRRPAAISYGLRVQGATMRICGLVLAMAVGSSAALAQGGSITVWPKGVPPTAGARADFGDHTLSISHREGNGRVEVHQNKADVIVVQSGTARLDRK